MKTVVGESVTHEISTGCKLLALWATTISLSLSMFVGWQLGESLPEKLLMSAFGVLAVLSAHLLPALCQPASVRVRVTAMVLWLFCIMYAAYSHANFFLSSQQLAGMRRAAAIDQPLSKWEPKRNLYEILADQARVKTELATKSQIECRDSCARLLAKINSLKARLDVLNAESEEVRRWQMQQSRQEALQDAARDDPVTTRLAKWLGVTVSQIDLVTSFLFSLILEGVACLGWYVVMQFRCLAVTQPVMAPITTVSKLTEKDDALDVSPKSEQDVKVEELIREVKAGRLRLTVNGVRDHCRCAQKKAAELKRLVEAKLNTEIAACQNS